MKRENAIDESEVHRSNEYYILLMIIKEYYGDILLLFIKDMLFIYVHIYIFI